MPPEEQNATKMSGLTTLDAITIADEWHDSAARKESVRLGLEFRTFSFSTG
jgi:hypothetical protein